MVSKVPSPHLWFLHAKQRLLAGITSLYGPRLHLSICACKTARFVLELHVSVGPRPHLSFCELKTACLSSDLLVSMGPSSHLWFLDAKQRLLDQNNKSLPVPDITCRFVHAKHRD